MYLHVVSYLARHEMRPVNNLGFLPGQLRRFWNLSQLIVIHRWKVVHVFWFVLVVEIVFWYLSWFEFIFCVKGIQ